MFDTAIVETVRPVSFESVTNPITGKEYTIQLTYDHPNDGPIAGTHVFDFYITSPDPHCDVLVGFGKKGYFEDEFDETAEMLDDVKARVNKLLPYAYERFEAIMASGIKGNELSW